MTRPIHRNALSSHLYTTQQIRLYQARLKQFRREIDQVEKVLKDMHEHPSHYSHTSLDQITEHIRVLEVQVNNTLARGKEFLT